MSEDTLLGGTPAATEPAPAPAAPSAEPTMGSPLLDPYIPADLAGEKVWEASRGKPIADVLKRFVEAHKFATGAIKLPGEKDKPEEAQAKLKDIYGKLGRPESPEKYTVKTPALPEGVQWEAERETAFRGVAHQLNLTQSQVQGLIDWYGGDVVAALQGRAQAAEQQTKETQAALKDEWGAAYKQNVALAERALQTIAKDALSNEEATAFLDRMVASGMGRDPSFVKMLANLGPMLGPDKLVTGDAPTSTDGLQKQIDEIYASEAFNQSMHPGHDEAVNKAQKLFQLMENPLRKAMQES